MKSLFLYILTSCLTNLLLAKTAFAQDGSPEDIKISYDIAYKKYLLPGGRELTLLLDVYQPAYRPAYHPAYHPAGQPAAMVARRAAKKMPVIIFVHGGGFVEGDKGSKLYTDMATAFAKHGYVCFSVNYKLKARDAAYSHEFLDSCISDVMAAKRWICLNAARYNIDTTAVIICGDSAGGGIVVNTSYDPAYAFEFTGCIDLWGGLPGGKGWESPIFENGPGPSAPPTCLIHGDSDRVIPFSTSEQLSRQLSRAGICHELHRLKNADHYPVNLSGEFIPVMIAFADRLVTKGAPAPKAASAQNGVPDPGSADLLPYVNPFIGTENSGNTNPGPVMPWGMVSISPFNTYDPQTHTAEASPYHHDRKTISGFTHLNMSGVGCADMGIFCLMPTMGRPDLQGPGAVSAFSQEKASPGYYSVMLDRYHIRAELSAALRSSIACFTFPAGRSDIQLNLGIGMTTKKGAMIRWASDTEVEGFKHIGNICGLKTDQTVYFFTRLSRKPTETGLWVDGKLQRRPEQAMTGDGLCALFSFDTAPDEKIYAVTGISYVSTENARQNLDADQRGFDLQLVRNTAAAAWNKALSVIRVAGGSRDDKTKFYTALYHTLLHPNIFEDANGQYRLFDQKGTGRSDSIHRYTVFSLWDTYRTLHPLMSLLFPRRQSAMVRSLLGMAAESGWLPRWEYAGIESGAMNGDPSLSVIADTWLRGIRDFNIDQAYQSMKHNALTPEKDNYLRPGMTDWLHYGYIPSDAPNILHPFSATTDPADYKDMRDRRMVWGPVSTSLEYCIADGSLAALAKALGKKQDHAVFHRRSMLYKNCFDKSSGFMRSRLANGAWTLPFDPASHRDDGFTEGSSWNYSFMAPHDIPGLIDLVGGPKRFLQKLDSCFDGKQFDITNEPDLAYPFLYCHLKGHEWKTRQRVTAIIKDDFSNTPGGLPGNDDCGSLSAWLVFSMLGIYPDCPANMDYQVSGPVFDTVTIKLDPDYYPGKTFVITAHSGGDGQGQTLHKNGHGRISSFRLNGKPYKNFQLRHEDIVHGGRLDCLFED